MRTERAHRFAVAFLIGLLAALAPGSGVVLAHAELLEVVPADGSVVPESPSGVTLRFSEAVSLVGGSVRLLDDEGSLVADGASSSGEIVTLPLSTPLTDGTYTIAWAIVSEDSHRISGASVFHVGAPSTPEPAAVDAGDDELPWSLRAGTTALMAVAYAAVLLAVGLAWFAAIVARLGRDEAPRWRDVVLRAGIVGLLALLVALPARMARVGGGIDALGDGAFVVETLRGPIGLSTLVTIVGLAALVAVVATRRTSGPALLAAVGVIALGGFAIEGHTRTMQPRPVMAVFDVLHLVAGAVWLGGIVGLVIVFRAGIDAPRLTGSVRRFSTVAVGAVVVVAAAGTGMAVIVLPSPSDLWSTGYGLVLVAKVALVAVVVALGAYNRRRLVPAVSAGAAASTQLLRDRLARVVRLELAVLLAVIAVTALLVSRSPMESQAAAPPPVARVVESELSGGVGTVIVAVPPRGTGYFETAIELRDPTGQPLVPAAVPSVELVEPTQGLGPLEVAVHEVAPGGYHVFGEVPVPGMWQLQISVRVTEFDLSTATITVEIP